MARQRSLGARAPYTEGVAIVRRHSSFLLRCWDLGSQGERIEIEHIQSGTKWLARSITTAVERIGAFSDSAVTQQGQGEGEDGGGPTHVIGTMSPLE